MKTKLSTVITTLLMSVTFTSLGQKLDGYKYVVVRTLTYQNEGTDIYGISATLRRNFEAKGFKILYEEDKSELPLDVEQNKCIYLMCYPFSIGVSTVGFKIKNCKGEILFNEQRSSANWIDDIQDNYKRALKNCWSSFDALPYSFNPSKTPEIDYPEVEKTLFTENTIKDYLTTNKTDPIEGIYKSYDAPFYKIGIIKSNDKFKAIILESELLQWKIGEVKAIFEQSSMRGFYSTKWYMANKTPFETFANMDNDALLTIELKDNNGEKRESKFVKMFPISANKMQYKKETSKSSGSGFFLSTTGIVATNAHVISEASTIEIIVSNEIGTFIYKAKVLLSDTKNDVALIQIDDSTFKGLSSIPYGLSEKGEVGEKVFTIGYPLNDVMGTNYKLTDGIISSKSGIEDDVRYYQISVPLQPGNSGGPLFNKDGIVIGITSSKLNSKAVGTELQNVNYAIKSSYLLNLYNMLPNSTKIEPTSRVANKQLQDQVKVLKNYVCIIKIY